MRTPIVDFVKEYIERDVSRLHMPGHKGVSYLGCESLDITEIDGADVLYSADGIINESEENASSLFRTAHTFYSTEGSSLAIKAMLSLACTQNGYVLAARNAHKSFVYACAILDIEVEWIYPEELTHLCSCNISAKDVRLAIEASPKHPCAVYVTSPDYLGNILDIRGIADICEEYGIPLLVDNAHGAYLAFCEPSLHPIDLGATMCCDSAHKTLDSITGGAYLHIAKKAPIEYLKNARVRLSLFASTSPSYLILQSLDLCNKILSDDYKCRLQRCIDKVNILKLEIENMGFSIYPSEPLKLVLDAKKSGYYGCDLARKLREDKLEFEFSDKEYIVAMFAPSNRDIDYERLLTALSKIKVKPALSEETIVSTKPQRTMSIREAVFSESETVAISNTLGRVCASPTVACPPAVPVVMSGELIGENEISLLKRYGIDEIEVVK